jgi:hypothetical protein
MTGSHYNRFPKQCFSLVLVLSCAFGTVSAASSRAAEDAPPVFHSQTPKMAEPAPSMKLEGKLEIRDAISGWQASQAYQQGFMAMQSNNFVAAADMFKYAGDGFESAGLGRFAGEARYAQAQANKLLRRDAQASKLFGMAADLFRKYDPKSPFLKAAMARMDPRDRALQGKATTTALSASTSISAPTATILKTLPAHSDTVSRTIPLKGKLTQFEDGTKLASLKDDEFFNGGSKRLLPEAAACDVTDLYVKEQVLKSFAEMNCLEFTTLGGNQYTAPDSYGSLKADGKNVIVGAADDFWTPTIKLSLNGRQYGVSMDLPGKNKYSHNVLVVTDGQHILALDPRTHDTWKLMASFSKKTPEFDWEKLSHIKKPGANL